MATPEHRPSAWRITASCGMGVLVLVSIIYHSLVYHPAVIDELEGRSRGALPLYANSIGWPEAFVIYRGVSRYEFSFVALAFDVFVACALVSAAIFVTYRWIVPRVCPKFQFSLFQMFCLMMAFLPGLALLGWKPATFMWMFGFTCFGAVCVLVVLACLVKDVHRRIVNR